VLHDQWNHSPFFTYLQCFKANGTRVLPPFTTYLKPLIAYGARDLWPPSSTAWWPLEHKSLGWTLEPESFQHLSQSLVHGDLELLKTSLTTTCLNNGARDPWPPTPNDEVTSVLTPLLKQRGRVIWPPTSNDKARVLGPPTSKGRARFRWQPTSNDEARSFDHLPQIMELESINHLHHMMQLESFDLLPQTMDIGPLTSYLKNHLNT